MGYMHIQNPTNIKVYPLSWERIFNVFSGFRNVCACSRNAVNKDFNLARAEKKEGPSQTNG
jgi:hypothetical protein